MRSLKKFIFKFYPISYIILAFISYVKNENLLVALSMVSMYNIAFESLIRAKYYKTKIEIRTAIDNDGEYKPVKIWPIYVFVFIFLALGVAQLTNFIHFSKVNNLIISLGTAVYLLYRNEKSDQANQEYEVVKQNYIKKHGQEAWDKSERDHENFMKELEEKFLKDK